MQISVRSNAAEVLDELDAFVGDTRQAMRIAASRLRDQAQTVGLRKINEIYRIGPRTMERFVVVRLEDRADGIAASISARGKGFPLYLFDPRQTRAGVSVSVKGKRFVIPHTFIARMKSGRVGVFARGAYGAKGLRKPSGKTFGRFAFGVSRLPINELYTLSPPDALANPDVTEAMAKRVEEQAGKVIKAAMRFGRSR